MRRRNPFTGPPLDYHRAVKDAFRPPPRCATPLVVNSLVRINVTRKGVSPTRQKSTPPMIRNVWEIDLSQEPLEPPTTLSTPEPKSRHAMKRTYSCTPDRASRVFEDGTSPGTPEKESPVYDGILEGSYGQSSKEVRNRSNSRGLRTYGRAPDSCGSDLDRSGEAQLDGEPLRDIFEGASGLPKRDTTEPMFQRRIAFHDPPGPRNAVGQVVFNQEERPLDSAPSQTKLNLQDRFAGAAGDPTKCSWVGPFRASYSPSPGSPEARHRPCQRGGVEGAAAGSRPAAAWEHCNYENERTLRKPRANSRHRESTQTRILGVPAA